MHTCQPIRAMLCCVALLLLAGCELAGQVEGANGAQRAAPTVTAALPAAEAPGVAPTAGEPGDAGGEVEAPEITATATAAPTSTAPAPPTATSPRTTVTPSPTPAPRLFRLTEGGCCTQPFWSPDSSEVRFIDKPSPEMPVGIWSVPVQEPPPAPFLVTEQIGSYSADGEFLIETGENITVIRRLSDGSRWEVATQGATPVISPGGQRIAWEVRDRSLPFSEQVAEIWVAAIDGSGAERRLTLPRGSVDAWLSEDLLLLDGRGALDDPVEHIFTLSVSDGSVTNLASSDRLRGEALSPGRTWLAYFISQSAITEDNGLWLARTDGSARYRLPDEFFGAYQWRDDGRLLVVPFRPEAEFHEFWEIDAASGEATRLIDPAMLPIKIANGDWRVSPDGRYIAFVDSRDDNIWLLKLP